MTRLVLSPPHRASGRDHDRGRACDCVAGRADHGAGAGEAGHRPQRRQLSAKVCPRAARGPGFTGKGAVVANPFQREGRMRGDGLLLVGNACAWEAAGTLEPRGVNSASTVKIA